MMKVRDAEKLTTTKEFSLFKFANRDATEIDSKRLKSMVAEARKLRDKYRELTQRQTRKGSAQGAAPARTKAKAELFQDVLASLESKVAKKESSSSRASPKVSRKAPASQTHRGRLAGASSAKKERFLATDAQALPARKSLQLKKASSNRIQGHVSSQGKRAQKRRDLKNA